VTSSDYHTYDTKLWKIPSIHAIISATSKSNALFQVSNIFPVAACKFSLPTLD